MKDFWQHTDGRVYAIQSDTVGHIMGVAGPLDRRCLHDPKDYQYESREVAWITRAIAHHDLRRINPKR